MIVLLDKYHFFTGTYAKIGDIEAGIEVNELPPDLSENKATSWNYSPHFEEVENPNYIEGSEEPKTLKKYVEWVFDEERYKNILAEIKAEEERQAKILNNEELTSYADDLCDVILEQSKGEML